ncbi:RHS repeat protein, partial [Pantoea agglomerans]|uniref:RHS repeat protein n=1 Tax=Enterobacter agglomerans TaxID=549 RepID=UPI001046D353
MSSSEIHSAGLKIAANKCLYIDLSAFLLKVFPQHNTLNIVKYFCAAEPKQKDPISISLFSNTPSVTVPDNRGLTVRDIAFHRHPDAPDVTGKRVTRHRYDARLTQ